MPKSKFKVGDALQGMRESFEQDRSLIIRLTLAFAALNAAAALLDVAGAAGLALSFGLTLLLGAGYGGMITALICLPGKSEDSGELWAAVKPVLARLIWVTLITVACAIAGIAALIIPGLIIATIWSVAIQTVVVERKGVFEALGRSYDLVRGNGIRVFGYLFILGLFSLVMLALTLLVSAPLGTGTAAAVVSSFLSNLLSTPVLAIGAAVLYTRLKALEPADPPEEADPFSPS